MAITVRMLADETAQWPARCVRCNAHEPRDEYVMRIVRRRWYGVRRAPDVVVRVPACALCVGALRAGKFWRMFFIFFPGAVLALLGLYLAQTNVLGGRFWDRWAVKVFGLAGALPGVVFHMCLPLPIEIELETRKKRRGRGTIDRVSYQFASDELAQEFMAVNVGRPAADEEEGDDTPGAAGSGRAGNGADGVC